VAPGSEVVSGGPSGPLSEPTYLSLMRIAAFDLGPAPGVLQGLRYPLGQDLDGLYSPLSAQMRLHYLQLPMEARAPWLRTLGVSAAVLSENPGNPNLQLLGERERFGGPSRLFAVRDPAPLAWWPASVAAAGSPGEAFRSVSLAPDPVAGVIADRPVPHHPGARVTLRHESPDSLEIDVAEDGGLLVLRRAFQPLYRASAEGKALSTLPVNLCLLGIEVPPGEHRVRVDVSSWPEALAGGLAVLTLLGAAILVWRRDTPGDQSPG